ncbi:MAG: hypothetical protein JJ863_08575 [Deltaproteobacteria bacterium]|nr:hypothetical protein [Deltaproteobacteria bacterium]
MTEVESDLRCAEASIRAGEPLAGTAAVARHWLAIEEPGAWARKPLQSKGLGALGELLTQWDEATPELRIQLIRQPGRRHRSRRVFHADLATGRLTHATLEDDELAALDPESFLGDGLGANFDGLLYLVCTHGKRDDCCALRGVPVYQALAEAAADLPASDQPELWQTSHLGGHRFAATLTTLPHGYALGRVEPDEAEDVLAAGGLHRLDRVRGRSLWPQVAQVADFQLRSSLPADHPARLDPAAVRVREVRESDAGWIVGLELVNMGSPERHTLEVHQIMSPMEQPKSCGDAPVAVPRLLAKAKR